MTRLLLAAIVGSVWLTSLILAYDAGKGEGREEQAAYEVRQ